MRKVFNFSAGPAMLPESVLRQAADEMLDWHGSGQSVMEMSHRGKEFTAIAERAEADLRALLGVPDGYHVLFLQGGASLQFEMIPMNLLRGKPTVGLRAHRRVGQEGDRRRAPAGRAEVNVAASAEDRSFTYVPDRADWRLSEDAAYVHYTANETIGGVEFACVPDVGDVPLISDMSSNLLSRPVDVSRFGLIYAGAQKNIGPAGLTIVIVRDDLVGLGRSAAHRRCSTTRRTSRPTRCTTRRPRTRSTSPDWSSRSCWPTAGWRRPSSATSPRPRCCTTPSTASPSTPTRSSRRTGRG